jgi:hypothetical protein
MEAATHGHAPDSPAGAGIHDAVSRIVASIGLAGIALIHVLELPDAFAATGYLGGLFVAAIVGSLVLSSALTRSSDERLWAAAGGVAALVLLGYILSRSVGLPAFTDDVGEWSEPLGLASMVAEGLLICVTAGVLASSWQAAGEAGAHQIEIRSGQGTEPGPAARAS